MREILARGTQQREIPQVSFSAYFPSLVGTGKIYNILRKFLVVDSKKTFPCATLKTFLSLLTVASRRISRVFVEV